MNKLKFGTQIYTFREYCRTPKLFSKTMFKIAEMGFKYVQLSDGLGEEVTKEMLLEESQKNGLTVGLTHWDDDQIINNTEEVIEFHDRLGCDGIGIGGMPREFRNRDGYLKFIDKYGKAIEKIGKAGKHFCYHNHWFEFERFDGKWGIDILLDNAPDGFALTCDTAWVARAGVDVAKFITERADKIYATHLKDMTIINDEVNLSEMLTGNMNFDPIMKAIAKSGIEWNFLEQDWINTMNTFDSVRVSRENMLNAYPQFLK